jgi:hypothetical protein
MDKYPELHGTDQVVVETKAERRKRKEAAKVRRNKRMGK